MSQHGFFQLTQKLFIRKGNLLLILRDRKSQLGDLPGGRMNQDEFYDDWLKSLERELFEELGGNIKVKINPRPMLVYKHKVNDGNYPCIIVGYHGEYESGDLMLSEEHDYFEWIDVNQYDPELLFADYMLDAINYYLDRECVIYE